MLFDYHWNEQVTASYPQIHISPNQPIKFNSAKTLLIFHRIPYLQEPQPSPPYNCLMKEAVFMTVDMGRGMLAPYSETMTRNHLAFQCIKLFLQQKIFNANKHHFGLALFGDDAEDGHCYPIHELAEPKLEAVRQIAQLSELKIENKLEGGDIFQALKFSIDSLNDHVGTKKAKKRLFLFTSGEGKTDYSKEDIRSLSEIINQTGVKINIIAIDFMESYDEETNKIDGVSSLNLQQEANSKHLMKLRQLCSDNLRILPASIAIELYREFRKKETNRVAVYRGTFELSPGLNIDIATYTESREDKLTSLKKYNNRVGARNTPADKDLIQIEALYQIQGDTKGQVIESENVISAFRYGDGVVPMTDCIKNEVAIFDEKCMELIGFVEKEHIPRHYFMGNVYKVIPGDNETSKKLFSAFIYSMLEMEKYALCRHISRNNKNGVSPKLVVLMPFKSSKGECFYMTEMPVLGEIREYAFNPLSQSTPAEQKLVDELIEKMDLMTLDEDGEAVKVQNLLNPTKQYLYQSLFHRVTHQDEELPPLDSHIREYISPELRIAPRTEELMVDIKRVFGLKKNEITKDPDTRKIVWAELLKQKEVEIEESIATADSGEQLAYWKKFNFEPQPVGQIDPASPVESFNFMISYQKKDLVSKAIKQLIEFIENQLSATNIPDQTKHNKLIMDCLTSLRNGCIREKEEAEWDHWLEKSIEKFGGEMKFKLKEKGLGFILRSNGDLYKVENEELSRATIKIEYDDLE